MKTEHSNTNYRTWKKGKTWIYGYSIAAVLAGGVIVSAQTVNAEKPLESSIAVSESLSAISEKVDNIESAEIPVASSSFEKAETSDDSNSSATSMSEASKQESSSASESSSTASNRSDFVKVTTQVVSSDITILKGNLTSDHAPSTTLAWNAYGIMGAKGSFTAKTSDLVVGNTIVIADVALTSDSSGELASFDKYGTSGSVLDADGKVIGTIQYDAELKAITFKVINTVTNQADTQFYSFSVASVMIINSVTSNEVRQKMPFTNTVTVKGKDFTFKFTEMPKTSDATVIMLDTLALSHSAGQATDNQIYNHEDISDNEVLKELQDSHGEAGTVKKNSEIKKIFRYSTESEIKNLIFPATYLSNYYVSAVSNQIQGQIDSGDISVAKGSSVTRIFPSFNAGEGVELADLLAKATSSGFYYSRQDDGSYIVVEYISPEDTILTKEEIESNVRKSVFATTSSNVDADVQATLDYYNQVLGNRASQIGIYPTINFVDQFEAHTVITEQLDESGNVIGTRTNTSTPNSFAEGNTAVKVNYLDLSGVSRADQVVKQGAPTDKEDDMGNIPPHAEATVQPAAITGYTLVTDPNSLTDVQKTKLEKTLSELGLKLSDLNNTSSKAIFATKEDNVPYPGFDDVYYDKDGNRVEENAGDLGYGVTNVYYFYVGNPQKVVYNIIDDTTSTESNPVYVDDKKNAEYASGYTGENVDGTEVGKTLDEIIAEYIGTEESPGQYELVSNDSVPGVYDSVNDPTGSASQVINIHLKHRQIPATSEDIQLEKTVNEKITYVYNKSGGTQAADPVEKSITFTRTAMVDTVTGDLVPGTTTPWTSSDTSFAQVDSPDIPGYTPDKDSIDEQPGVTGDDLDTKYTFEVIYTPEAQKVVYNVIDDDKGGEKLEDTVDFDSGVTDGNLVKTQEDLDAIIKGHTDQGYEKVSADSVPGKFDNVDDETEGPQVINIHLKHHHTTTTETKEVDETIHYVYEDGSKAADNKTDKVTFTRDTVTDDVTKEVVSQTEWTAKDDDTTFDEKVSPEIDGYTPDKAGIPEVTGLTESSAPVEETVTYKKNAGPDKPTPPIDTPTVPSETPTPKPIELPTGTPAATPAQKGSILPSTGEERTAAAVVGGLVVAAAGIIALLIHLRRKKQ